MRGYSALWSVEFLHFPLSTVNVFVSGYTYDEKMHIARRFLLPKQLKSNGLETEHVQITEPALLHVATRYTREAGVRSLERAIGSVARYKAVEWAECMEEKEAGGKLTKQYNPVVEEHELEKILGIARWDGEEREREERRGIAYGLVVMGQGEGGVMPVETIALPGSGRLKLTGSLGEVRGSFACNISTYSFVLLGDPGKRRAGFELGQNVCLRSMHHQHTCRRSVEGPRAH